MAVWGLNLSAVKVLTGRIEMLDLASLRMLLALGAMSFWAVPRLKTLPQLHAGQWWRLVLCAALMVYGNQVLMLSGMHRSSATNASLVVALSPLAALAVAAIAFRERLGVAAAAGLLIGFSGVAAVIFARPGAQVSAGSMGDLLLLLSVISFAIGGALVQRLARRIDPLVISWAIHGIGAAMLLAHTLAAQPAPFAAVASLGPWDWLLLVFSGAVATGLGNMVWNHSISTIGVARTTAALYWVPIFGIGFAIVALGETASPWHGLGLAAVFGGTWLTSRADRGRRTPGRLISETAADVRTATDPSAVHSGTCDQKV